MTGYGLLLLRGFGVTMAVALAALAVAVALGGVIAWVRIAGGRKTRAAATFYTTAARGIPELVTILLVFYGLPTLVNAASVGLGYSVRVEFDAFLVGVLTLGGIYAAFMAEVMRGAILSVPAGQRESAAALGLRPVAVLWRVTGPQALRLAAPGMANVWLVLLKATAITSVIQLDEVMRAATVAARATKAPFTWYFYASLAYLAVALVSMAVQARLEAAARAGARSAG